MKTAHDIIEAAGRANVRSRMDVGDRVLQLYIKDDKLPAAWFDDLHEGMAIDMSLVENEDREAASLQEAEDLLAEIKRMNGE